MAKQMRALGFPDDAIDGFRAGRASASDVVVFADCWQALEVFAALGTQWNVVAGGMGGVLFTGLRYEGLPIVFDLVGVEPGKRGEVFEDVRTMEAAAMKVLNDRS